MEPALASPRRPHDRIAGEPVKIAGLIVFVGVLAIIYAWLFALWDVVAHQSELSPITRIIWLIAVLFFNVLGTAFYLRLGPGAAHWPPWESTGQD